MAHTIWSYNFYWTSSIGRELRPFLVGETGIISVMVLVVVA
ncbi:hypothetical protein [Enterococcus raffinosus]